MKKITVSVIALYTAFISFNFYPAKAENLAVNDFTFTPVYVAGVYGGQAEEQDAHWLYEDGVYTRINDTENFDAAESQATLYFNDIIARYFELEADIKVANETGLTGFVFGAWDIFTRFTAGAEAFYITKDSKVGFWGSHLKGPGNGLESNVISSIRAGEFSNIKLRVDGSGLKVFANGNQVFALQINESKVFEGRLGIFTTKASSSFKNIKFTLLDEQGNETEPNVRKTVNNISFQNKTKTIELSQKSFDLNYVIMPADAYNINVYFVVDNYSVAAVSASGKVNLLKEGVTDIFVYSYDGRLYDSLLLTITEPEITMENLQLNKAELSLKIGEEATLFAVVSPVDLENYSLRWSSSNTAVVMINNGVVTAIGAGEAVITVRDGDRIFSATCTVKVNEAAANGCSSNFTANSHLLFIAITAIFICGITKGGKNETK